MSTEAIAPAFDRWTPIENGVKFCSPACGYGCTKAAYHRACADAEALAKEMGENWTTRVWENLGWHHSVLNADAKVSPSRDHYTCIISGAYSVCVTRKTAKEAYSDALIELGVHTLKCVELLKVHGVEL